MEMLLLQPSLEPELCLGKAAQWRSLCSVRSPHAQQLDALGAFFEGLEVHPVLTSLGSVALSEKVISVGRLQTSNALIFSRL